MNNSRKREKTKWMGGHFKNIKYKIKENFQDLKDIKFQTERAQQMPRHSDLKNQ